MEYIVHTYSKKIGAKPRGLKFDKIPKILTDYFTDPSTCRQSNETGFPFCTWKNYCYLADEFVNYFSKQISTEVCEEEAMVLVDALLREGQCDTICSYEIVWQFR